MKTDVNSWYNGLSSQGLTLSSVILSEILPQGPEAIDSNAFDSIKRAWLEFRTKCDDFDNRPTKLDVRDWLMTLFCEGFGNLRSTEVQPANSDGSNISNRFKASLPSRSLIPDFVIRREGNTNRGRLLSMLLPPNVRMKGASKAGKVQRDLVLLLRHCRLEFGLLSNGHQIRLIRVTPEDVSWIQWDPSIWFEHAEGRKQLDGLNALLGKESIGQEAIGESRKDGLDRFRLQDACAQSRQRQSSLSAVVGEGVRQSVEKLVNQLNAASLNNPELLDNVLKGAVPRSDDERSALSSLHQAAVRIVMRMIVIFFAEARDLLPHRSSPTYRENYSLTRLLEQLEDSNSLHGDDVLNHTTQAWSRILSLFDLVHDGSHHEVVSIHAYGGELFRPGDNESNDNVISALAAFEDPKAALTDTMVLEVLRKLRRSKMKANINGKSTWVATTVDYSTMDTEFIGMVYEGLLDYELRRVHEDDGAMVTLRIGQQPMLPLSLLENQDDAQLSNLIKELSKNKDTSAPDIEDKNSKADSTETAELIEDDSPEDKHDAAALRALNWALRAVDSANLVKMPKGKKAAFADVDELKRERAEELLIQVHAPGDMFLVNYSGNRKGSGTFYTPPGLSIPTVRRTLEPLCYDVEEEETEDGLIRTLTPKTPQEILSLTVCDPAMGSGSFLVAALRYLTDALFTSLESHSHFAKIKSGTRITLPAGTVSSATESEDLLLHPDDARFEIECKARLKRYIAQRCIYGVDLNPMAVELGKMALWVETLSRDLPFEFLDHHIKCGNSLVGAWFDGFEHFPLAAFARDTGDSGTKHASPVHHQRNTWRDLMKNHIKDLKDPTSSISVATMIKSAYGQRNLFNFSEKDPMAERKKALAARRLGFEKLQKLALHDPLARELAYRDLQSESMFQELKLMMDTWSACWFWPPDKLHFAPKPSNFRNLATDQTLSIVNKIVREQKFFHWELEFPDIFVSGHSGFSAIIGNPPWEELRPNSIEFFSRYDSIWNTYGSKSAKQKMTHLFEDNPSIEYAWVSYNDGLTAFAHFCRYSNNPWGYDLITIDKKSKNQETHDIWRQIRSSCFDDKLRKGFELQGENTFNFYKLFLEFGWNRLSSTGSLGMIVPHGIYGDSGTKVLRNEFLTRGTWEWLFMFVNYNSIFPIANKSKFGAIIVNRVHSEKAIKSTFLCQSLADWDQAELVCIDYDTEITKQMASESKVFIEIRDEREIGILNKIIKNSIPLGQKNKKSWNVKYLQGDYNMTSDSDKFTRISDFTEIGLEPDEFGIWSSKEGDVFMPLFQGIMMNVFEFNRATWISGSGHSAKWSKDLVPGGIIWPQYLVRLDEIQQSKPHVLSPHIVTRNLGDSLSWRTSITTYSPGYPKGNSLGSLFPTNKETDLLALNAIMSTFCFDYHWRLRLTSLNQSWAFKKETRVPPPSHLLCDLAGILSIRLVGTDFSFATVWLDLKDKLGNQLPSNIMAFSHKHRSFIQACIEVIIAKMYGLDSKDLRFIFSECEHTVDFLSSRANTSTLNPKGFWRVDSHHPPNQRVTNICVSLMERLETYGTQLNEHDISKIILSWIDELEQDPEVPDKFKLTWNEWTNLSRKHKTILGKPNKQV